MPVLILPHFLGEGEYSQCLANFWLLVNNCQMISAGSQSLPDELARNYGLTIQLLGEFFQIQSKSPSTSWSLHGIPFVEFYRKLHPFLKKWSATWSLPKTTIGKFYLSIDRLLQARGSSPYNTYKFVERVISSDVPDSSIMMYGADQTVGALQAEVRMCSKLVQELTAKAMKQQTELSGTRQDVENIREREKMTMDIDWVWQCSYSLNNDNL